MDLPKGGMIAKLIRTGREISRLRIGVHAANTSYFLILSLFPALVLLLGLLRYTQYDAADLVTFVEGFIPSALLPEAEVLIVSGSREKAAAYIHRNFTPGDRVLCFEEELPLYADCAPLSYGKEADVATLSAGLFDALRQLDSPDVKTVYARCPDGEGIAYAVQNRLKKAAAFRIIDGEVAL